MLILMFPVAAQRTDDEFRAFVHRVERAIQLAGSTELQACQAMGLSQSQWCAQKSGEQHLSLTRLRRVPDLLRWLAVLTLEDEGLPKELRRYARIALALLGRKQLRIAAHEAQRRRA